MESPLVAPLLCLAACSAAPAFREPFTGMVPTPGGRLWVHQQGSGRDVVLLHGLGDSSVTWRKVAPALAAAGFRVTELDSLGAGNSDLPAGPYDIPAHVERMRRVLDALGIERAVLVGNSLGGSIALRFCELQRQRAAALALISPAAFPAGGWTGNWLWEWRALPALLERLPPRAIAEVALRVNFGDRHRIGDDDVAIYTAAAARPGALRAFVCQQQQVMPDEHEVQAWIDGYRAL